MIIILFGLAGSGKSFVGKILQNHFGFYFWDADEALSPEMQEYIKKNLTFTQEMRNQLTLKIINKLSELKKSHTNIVISQALYKEQNRQTLLQQFPNSLFIQISTSPETIHKRLATRDDLVTIRYANTIAPQFETPLLFHKTLNNNSNEADIIKQLKNFLEKGT